MDEKDLNGTKRFVSDGLATENDCKSLLEMVTLFAQQGDGYKGHMSPHTEMEKFEGLTVGRAALLVYFGFLDRKALELYLKITENAKQHLEEQFNLKRKLYFNYTHLVCRSALPNSPSNRTDFSHAVHADNCNLISNGLCEKLPPAYTWRDYSAILYLNHDFKGGEFIFSGDFDGNVVQSSIRPKCGRMVGFSSGAENLHGVRAVKQGTRCAVALWFTFDKKHAETDRNVAFELIEEDPFKALAELLS
ncbi:hypothetical protein ILUMI_20562 [Ignelater luminosus]|uniref:procollagen-proline 3-dioxygenase n=1 Tax=Ignelater luminosus TaxID=2038154 RepID=A0A8K0CDY0_IGNLU|nr:hypothetical protein ILUMI_20562 [Ignelater luminosus]